MLRKHNKNVVGKAKELRKNLTKEERRLWYNFLSNYPVRFYRQKVLGKYVVDFYCAKAKLVVELDGSQHYEDKNLIEDEKRTDFLKEYGLFVLRIPNNLVNQYFTQVCEYIDNIVNERIK